MAYGGALSQRDNFNRFQKNATINITKKLQKIAETTQNKLQEDVAEKLLETYKTNVELSYAPRGDGSYEHTGIFLDSIHVDIEKEKVKIVIDNVYYNQLSHRSTTEVHEFLTEGTDGGGVYDYWDTSDDPLKDPIQRAYNYPTPKHYFEEHTMMEMKGYLASLDISKYVKKGAK